ncbi:unnamed protein product [Effrenium voratum]|nr:unnamed protein product [Effrenium voratum]
MSDASDVTDALLPGLRQSASQAVFCRSLPDSAAPLLRLLRRLLRERDLEGEAAQCLVLCEKSKLRGLELRQMAKEDPVDEVLRKVHIKYIQPGGAPAALLALQALRFRPTAVAVLELQHLTAGPAQEHHYLMCASLLLDACAQMRPPCAALIWEPELKSESLLGGIFTKTWDLSLDPDTDRLALQELFT